MQERKAKVEAEFAGLADYTVISKQLELLKNGRIHTNDPIVNLSIQKFLDRVCKYIGAEWIFYQMDYIAIFNELLEDNRVLYSPKHEALIKVINHILDAYFVALEKNPFLIIESFFRFTNREQMI